MSITRDVVIEQVDTEIILVIEDAIGGEVGDSVQLAASYASQALAHRNAAASSAGVAASSSDNAVDAADVATQQAIIAEDAAQVATDQAAVALTIMPTLVSMATDIIKTQTIVVNHHGFI